MSWRGLALGAVGLAVVDAVLTHAGAANRVGGWLLGASNLVAKIVDPTVPFFAASSSSSSSSQPSTTPQPSSGVVTPNSPPGPLPTTTPTIIG